MLRKFINWQLQFTEKGKPLEKLRPLVSAIDTFLAEPAIATKSAPYIRDSVDLKRWMIIVIFALLPCIFMAIWNTGVQKFVYSSMDHQLMNEFLASSHSITDYFNFCTKDARLPTILWYGASAFLPVMIISYMVGGLCEGIFACLRGHEIAEGFLVTGMLYALILPPTIPYWMVALCVAIGVIFSKEIFGGTGMNIMNPALCSRAFLFFTFPAQMSGDVWVGTNPVQIRQSLIEMNKQAGLSAIDGYTQATTLAKFNVGMDIKRVHVDAIATNFVDSFDQLSTFPVIKAQFDTWSTAQPVKIGALSFDQLKQFVTSSIDQGGLAMSQDSFENAYRFAKLQFAQGIETDWNFFLGNVLGCFGETSTLACLIGACILICTKVGSWRTMLGCVLGLLSFTGILQLIATTTGVDYGAWNPAVFAFPAYKHLLIGGFAFATVFMATDPVSSPTSNLARLLYGGLIGFCTGLIRVINPAYPEGAMLAVLTANVFAPLIDQCVVLFSRKFRYVAN